MSTHPLTPSQNHNPVMLRFIRRCLALTAIFALTHVFALASGTPRKPRVAATEASSAKILSEDDRGILLRLDAPDIKWTEAGGYLYPSAVGFGLLSEPDQPVLPVRILRVGVPAGSSPRLTIIASETASSISGSVGPVQRWINLYPGSEEKIPVGTEDPGIYEHSGRFPGDAPVRLGTSGFLREQAFVEIVFTPVLFNPSTRSSDVYRWVKVRVDFDESGHAGRLAPSAQAEDQEYESVYQLGLVNAGQARTFRGAGKAETLRAETGAPESGTRDAVPGTSVRAPAPALTALSTKYKLTVNKNGIYRLSSSWVGTNAPNILSFNPTQFRMDCLGTQIPITVVDTDAPIGTLNGNDYIEFYGQALSWDILSADEWNHGDFTDNNIYWLYADSAAGLRTATRSGTPTDTFLPPPDDFSETVHREVDVRFVQQVPQNGIDHWYEDIIMNSYPSPNPPNTPVPLDRDYIVQTPGVSTFTATASVKVRLLGELYQNNFHQTAIKVNRNANPTPVIAATNWSGFAEFTQGPGNFNQSILNDASPDTTTVTVTLPLGRPNVYSDAVDMNWIELTYGKLFKVDSDETLVFSYPNQNKQFKITGLASNTASVYEITELIPGTPLVNPVRITGVRPGAGPIRIEFQETTDGSLPATRRFAVATITASTSTGDLTPPSVKVDAPSNLHDTSNGADWLVVANPTFLDATPGSFWQNLLTRRTNQGLRVKVVDVEDIYDEFSFGISDPQAIRDFFAYVYASWTRINPAIPLQYGILLGDASYDYKNNYGFPQNKNLLSTYMRSVSNSALLGYMSDETYFANVVPAPDFLPDFSVGRWPVHSVAETNAIAKKILDYETSSPGQAWQRNLFFIADDDDLQFQDVQERQINDFLVGTPYTVNRAYERQIRAAHPVCTQTIPTHQPPGCWTADEVANEMRGRIQGNLNGAVDPARDIGPGAVVVSYVGHGGYLTWGSNVDFFETAPSGTDDLSPVSNAAKLPLILIADCISNAFAASNNVAASDISVTFGEDFLNTGLKGAIGVIAPSHLTFTNTHDTVETAFFSAGFGTSKTRGFGALMLAIDLGLSANGDTGNLQSYTLLGDPAVKLLAPAPGRPTSCTATPGNHQVGISWSSVPGANGYNVYQATHPSGPYERVCSGAPGTSCNSTSLTNCTPYFYTCAAVDPAGFEGPWSHLNTGCGSSGPCVQATPLNPSAPSAPTGFNAVDNESGGAVRVSWAPNPGADEVTYYKVYWGTSPGIYDDSREVGSVTTALITNLFDGAFYYFAVSAENCSQGEGSKSVEDSAVPHLIQGIKPPNGIDGLQVTRFGFNDTRLEWTPPTTNIYGQPYGQGTTLDHQEIFVGSTPLFATDAGHLVASVGGSTSAWIHPNGFTAPGNNYYLIVAIDSNGYRSGVGRELPRGIDDLAVTRSGGTVFLNWPAVTYDFDGIRTSISKYILYGRGCTPSPGQTCAFHRYDIGPGILLVDNITTTQVTRPALPAPPGAFFFYSIISVDNRGSLSPW